MAVYYFKVTEHATVSVEHNSREFAVGDLVSPTSDWFDPLNAAGVLARTKRVVPVSEYLQPRFSSL